MRQTAGSCCSLVYTSGTTGHPKGVMLSHDNYTWLQHQASKLELDEGEKRMLSFLPLSHVAAQFVDLVCPLTIGLHVHFTDQNALKGGLIDYMLDVRPNYFLAVPRVYEKMEEQVRLTLEEKPTIMRWALDVSLFKITLGWESRN